MLCVRYVPLAIIIGSKCATLRAFVQSTYVTEMIDLYGLHEMHVNFGLEVIHKHNFNQSALCHYIRLWERLSHRTLLTYMWIGIRCACTP